MIVRKVESLEKTSPLRKIKAGIALIALPLCLLLICAEMWRLCAPDLWGSYAVGDNEWLQTSGRVHEVKRTQNRGRSASNYRVTVRYSYLLEGKTYWGNRISFQGVDAGYSESLVVYKKYSRLKYVPVYYAPTDWNFSVLEPHDDFVPIGEAVFTLVLIASFLALIRHSWASLRKWRSEKPVSG